MHALQNRLLLFVAVPAFLAMLTSGCNSKDSSGMRGVSKDDAERMNAEHSKFGTGEDKPFTAKTHFAAGQLAESQGASQKAAEQYRAALRVDSGHLPSLYRLAVVYAATKHYPESIEVWDRYIKASKGDAGGYSNLGYTQELAGNARAAEEAYRKGLAADPANAPCHVNYGLLLAKLGRTEEAEKQLSAVLTPAQVRYNFGSVAEQQGQVDRARKEYEAALQLDPDLKEARSRLTKLGKSTGSGDS